MVCYRFAAYSTPLRTVPAWQPARFSRADEPEPTQYLSLHPLGPLAELMRNADLRTAEQVSAVSTRTWALEVPLDGLPEITFRSAPEFGITAEQLIADDHVACQHLAARLRDGFPGAIVPSAALPGTRNLVLFGPRVAAPYLVAPVSVIDIPASMTADRSGPPLSLRSVVRFRGDPHPALAAWQAGASFVFAEPDWSL
jgi:RES domain